MATRVTLGDVLASRLPQAVGLCSTDVAGVAAIVNSAQQRLLYAREIGDSGWAGGWSRMNFDVEQSDPYVVLPRGGARIIQADICTWPVPIRNEFWEFMEFGFGLLPKSNCTNNRCGQLQVLDRGSVATFSPIGEEGMKLRIYPTSDGDVGKRILVQGLDANGVPLSSLDGTVSVNGVFVELEAPFTDTDQEISVVTGLIKDETLARVSIYELNIATAEQRLISFMEPTETVADYRKYFFSSLPKSCCNLPDGSTTVQVVALVGLDLIPVKTTVDYLIVGNLEAIIQEAQAIRYSQIDQTNAKEMESYHHRQAIRLLQGQSVLEYGKDSPSVQFSPFGGAKLSYQRIGTLI